MPLSKNLPELITLAEATDLTDTEALEVRGQCLLVCVVLDPSTGADTKKKIPKRIATTSRQRSAPANDPGNG